MAQYSVNETDLQNYMREMIRYVIKNHRADIVNLLQANGVNVPSNTDNKTLHAMVLKATVSSVSFSNGLKELLQSIALDGIVHKSSNYSNINGQWVNQDGSTTIGLNNDTINGIISTGIDTLAYKLTNGGVGGASTDTNIKNEVNSTNSGSAPAPASQPIAPITVIVTLAVVVVSGIVIWKIIKKQKK